MVVASGNDAADTEALDHVEEAEQFGPVDEAEREEMAEHEAEDDPGLLDKFVMAP